jgi:hypothetical protein
VLGESMTGIQARYNGTPAGLPMLLAVAESGSSMGNLAGVNL